MRYWSREPHEGFDDTLDLVMGLTSLSDPLKYFVIDRDGSAIGCIGVYGGDEIGFILNRRHWRQGLMMEALNAYIPYAFETFDFDRLTADVDPRNVGSLALLDRAGFVETHRVEKTLFLYGEWCDSVYLSLPNPA